MSNELANRDVLDADVAEILRVLDREATDDSLRQGGTDVIHFTEGGIIGVSDDVCGRVSGLLARLSGFDGGKALLRRYGISCCEGVFSAEGTAVGLDEIHSVFAVEDAAVAEASGVEGCYSEALALADFVGLEVSACYGIGCLFEQCINFEQCKNLFGRLSRIPSFRERFLCPEVFEAWIAKCVENVSDVMVDDVIFVLELMKECGIRSTERIAFCVMTIPAKRMGPLIMRINEFPDLEEDMFSVGVLNEVMARTSDLDKCSVIFDIMIDKGTEPNEETYQIWFLKCPNFDVIARRVFVKIDKKLGAIPSIVYKPLLIVTAEMADAASFTEALFLVLKYVNIDSGFFDDIKLESSKARMVLRFFLLRCVVCQMNFEDLHQRARRGDTSHEVLRFAKNYENFRVAYYFLRSKVLAGAGQEGFADCKEPCEVMQIVDEIWRKREAPGADIVRKFVVDGEDASELLGSLKEFFEDRGLEEVDEIYNLCRVGESVQVEVADGTGQVDLAPWMMLYGKVREQCIDDKVRDVMDVVDLMWPKDADEESGLEAEELITPSYEFARSLHALRLTHEERVALRVAFKEYFSDKEVVFNEGWERLKNVINGMAESSKGFLEAQARRAGRTKKREAFSSNRRKEDRKKWPKSALR